MKPFGSPSGRQPFLPGPEGRYGRGCPVTAEPAQQQQQAAAPEEPAVNTTALDRSPGEPAISGPDADPESKNFGVS